MNKMFFILLVLLFCSCKKEDVTVAESNNKSALLGKWDSYKSILENGEIARDGPSYCVLFNYEQGFELLGNDSYQSRYTLINAESFGTWTYTSDSILFNHHDLGRNSEPMSFKILKLDNTELHIKNKTGLTHYLKRAR